MTQKSPKERAISAMQDMCSTAGLLYNGIRDKHEFTPEEIGIYINNLEFYVKDIATYFNYDSALAKQVTERYAELKEANAKINELQAAIRGSETNHEAVEAKLSLYEDIARAFYEAAGFNYGSVTFKNRALTVEMSAELATSKEPNLTTLGDMMAHIRDSIEEAGLTSFDTFDEGSYRYYVEDTQANKEKLIALYATMLPGAYAIEFSTRRQNHKWTLRHTVYIPYRSLEKLYTDYSKEVDQS